MTFFITIKNKVYGTVITRPLESDTIENAKSLAYSLLDNDEELVLITLGI